MKARCHDTAFGLRLHYNDVIMSSMAPQITSLTIVYSTVYSSGRSKKTSKLRVTGLCEGNSPVTGEFPAHRAQYAKNVSIWWRHHFWISSHPWVYCRLMGLSFFACKHQISITSLYGTHHNACCMEKPLIKAIDIWKSYPFEYLSFPWGRMRW